MCHTLEKVADVKVNHGGKVRETVPSSAGEVKERWGGKRWREEVGAENECETDRRLCAEAADGPVSSGARRENTAFVLPDVCFFFYVCVCLNVFYLSATCLLKHCSDANTFFSTPHVFSPLSFP